MATKKAAAGGQNMIDKIQKVSSAIALIALGLVALIPLLTIMTMLGAVALAIDMPLPDELPPIVYRILATIWIIFICATITSFAASTMADCAEVKARKAEMRRRLEAKS